jgi:hypothetical protein
MGRRGILIAAVVAGLAAPTTAWAATTNLIHNGGFEKPVVPAGGFQAFSTGQTFTQWTVMGASGNVAIVSGTFTQNGFKFPAKSGKQWLDLTGTSNTATGVSQAVATTPNATYTLRFSVGNVYDPTGIFGTKSAVNVFLNGTHVLKATNALHATPTQAWKSFTLHFKATSATTTIAFVNGDPPNDTNNGLDAISLTRP